MSRRTALSGGILAAALALGGLSCQLFVDVGGLSNGQCADGYKLCTGKCVSKTDPTHGCGSTDCVPCSLRNAYTACDPQMFQCSFKSCVGHYDYCTADPGVVGCPIDLEHDPGNCGGCGTTCDLQANSHLSGCMGGQCAVGSCTPPYEDCNHLYNDGCEINLDTDGAHCGACRHACLAGQTCSAGVCQTPDAGA